jgi:hypothetical protein
MRLSDNSTELQQNYYGDDNYDAGYVVQCTALTIQHSLFCNHSAFLLNLAKNNN